MTKHNINASQLALKAGIDKATLSRKMNGLSKFEYTTTLKLERATGIRGLAIHIMNEQIGERK
jgi:DNA-binding phage protein